MTEGIVAKREGRHLGARMLPQELEILAPRFERNIEESRGVVRAQQSSRAEGGDDIFTNGQSAHGSFLAREWAGQGSRQNVFYQTFQRSSALQ